ncbi:MAG TPA: 16S rRNA (cytidine(1402)-2'-O)-methyltransferase [Candidatus Saccharimonadales bacterium]|nr:16S rRNA (cytidine(1402)-2'-O)-methyltransferase [Candidatus Saccharimonadales bacterium]
MGTLYIVATPIGNLGDITFRAVEVLKSVDLVVCEDSRVTGKLLAHFDITKPMFVLNDFNEVSKASIVVEKLKGGQNVALVSDAGTPLVSDPGFKLVRLAVESGIKIESIPGSSAAIAALTVSGLPTDKFLFVGYLSKKDGKRKEALEQIKKTKELIKSTVILYESPYRVVKTLESIMDVFGDVDVCICRELTKIHEEIKRGGVSELIEFFSKSSPKGEFTLLF